MTKARAGRAQQATLAPPVAEATTINALPKGYPTISIDRVIPYARNARTHSDRQVAEIAGSIKEFGFKMPIGISFDAGPDGNVSLWAGHGRILGAAKLGMTEVPYVDWTDLTPTQRRMLAIADNKIALNAGWDENLLGLELADLNASGADMGLLGFNEAELNNLLKTAGDGSGEPEAPPPPEFPVSRIGDQWSLGPHVVRCGDSTNADDVAALLGGEQPLLMVTDPPYGVEYDASWRQGIKRANFSTVERLADGKVNNDDLADWTPAWELFKGDVAYVWHASLHTGEVQQSLQRAGFGMRANIIWNKTRITIGRGHYHWQHEPCWYAVRNGRKGHWNGDRKQSTVWDIPVSMGWSGNKDTGGDEHTTHSTQKPVECMVRPILNNSTKGAAVYDPFLGSGTTVIACERHGRRCFGMEFNPAYVDVIVMRWEKETGRKATLQGSTMTFDEVKAERLGPA